MQPKLAAALVVCLGAIAFAQSNQGTITGTVSDPAGAVIPAAQIEVKNAATGVVYRGGSSSTGNYVLAVPAGTYEISVTVPGFKKFIQSNVPVAVATDTRKDVTLELGSANEVVTVADTAPLLKTESGEVSHQVTIDEVDQLPVLTIAGGTWTGATTMGNIRNPLQVATLLPGVTFATDNALVVNGMPSNTEAIRIEGQDAAGTIWKVLQQLSQGAGVDAIQEVSVQTSNYAAEYGQAGGGYFNFTMKSGTNQLHGSAYDYFVNEALNAGLPFTDAGTQNPAKEGQHIRNSVRRNDYGFTLGGPVRIPKLYNGQNRTFFFFNFEQFRENRTFANNITTVPTPDYRAGNFANAGCFTFIAASNSCAFSPGITMNGAPAKDPSGQGLTYGEVFDPNTTTFVNGAEVRSPFPNQRIPLTRMDPVALAVQNMLPLPNFGGGITNNYVIPTYLNWHHNTNWSFKLDHSISPTIKLSWYLSRLLDNSPNSNGFTGAFGAPNPLANRNVTTRLNYDQTIRPTVLLHVGVGYIQQYQPTDYPSFNQSSIGLNGYFVNNRFPTINGLSGLFCPTGGWCARGFFGQGSLGPSFIAFIWEEKPTANINLTWVKGNHTFKYGGEYIGEGYPEHSEWRANGSFGFSNAETSDPWQNLQPLNFPNATGFYYASFLLGSPDSLQSSPVTQTRLGSHAIGLYAQDSWKVTRRLTLDYGLRYDFQTYEKEQYGRMADASFATPNPTVGGLPGAIAYEGYGGGRCNCALSHNYPYAFGPRFGLAYQVTPKTVIRAGFGVSYALLQSPSGSSYSVADFYSFNAPGYGNTPLPLGLQGGNPYPNLTWPNFNVGKFPTPTNGTLPPQTPFIFYDPEARPARTAQWSIGIQREVQKDIVVEATYLGNRGVWWAAPIFNQIASNSLTDQTLAAHNLSRNNPADLSLLTSLISSPQAVARGFGPAYPGMPPNQTVLQQLRPVPQWAGGPVTYLGPPIGKTWYDSLQTKVTKRFSHGLSMQGSFVWSKALDLGTGADFGYFDAGTPVAGDIFNYANNKQLNQLTRPLAWVISGTYTTPKTPGDSAGAHVVSRVARDWQLGWVLRYQSGALIESPTSINQLTNQLGRGTSANNFDNSKPGVNPLAFDPNCKCFNPQSTIVLNTGAWTDPAAGQWGASAPFYNNYRWQRQPAEAMSFARNFPVGKENRFNLQFRVEFQNVFNRLFLSAPATGAITSAPTSAGGVYTGGYGTIATINGAGTVPRSGQAVLRLNF